MILSYYCYPQRDKGPKTKRAHRIKDCHNLSLYLVGSRSSTPELKVETSNGYDPTKSLIDESPIHIELQYHMLLRLYAALYLLNRLHPHTTETTLPSKLSCLQQHLIRNIPAHVTLAARGPQQVDYLQVPDLNTTAKATPDPSPIMQTLRLAALPAAVRRPCKHHLFSRGESRQLQTCTLM